MYQKSCYNSRYISDTRYTYSYFYRVLKYFIYHNNRETDHCTLACTCWHEKIDRLMRCRVQSVAKGKEVS